MAGEAFWRPVDGGGATVLDDLTDVDLTTPPTDGQTILWDAGTSTFLPGDAPAGADGADGAPGADGAGELLMQDGVASPPVPLETEDGTDWLYEDGTDAAPGGSSSVGYVDVADYGAALDADGVTDVTATASSADFTSATAGWTVGQVLVVRGAGASGGTYTGTISSIAGTTATCDTAAGTSGSSLTAFYGTDDTAAWQAALSAAVPGDVVDAGSSWRSLCTGHLTLPKNVKLVRSGSGPHDPQNNPVRNVHGPTFVMVQDNTTAFVTMDHGAAVGDAIFYSANQLDPSATTPTTFKEIISIPAGKAGCFIDQPYLPNAWRGIFIRGGRHNINRPCIGALNRGVIIDESYDWVTIGTLIVQVFWNIVEGRSTSSTTGFDDHVLSNTWALDVRRADAFSADNVRAFRAYGVLLLNDSTDTSLSPRCGYGHVGAIDADTVAFGVYASATNAPGLLINQLTAGANSTGAGTPGQSAAATVAGGTVAPKVVVKSWSHRGTWAGGASSSGAGTLIVPSTNPG